MIRDLRTIILGDGSCGILRVVNSYKIGRILNALKLYSCHRVLLEQVGYGLHIVAIAQRR